MHVQIKCTRMHQPNRAGMVQADARGPGSFWAYAATTDVMLFEVGPEPARYYVVPLRRAVFSDTPAFHAVGCMAAGFSRAEAPGRALAMRTMKVTEEHFASVFQDYSRTWEEIPACLAGLVAAKSVAAPDVRDPKPADVPTRPPSTRKRPRTE